MSISIDQLERKVGQILEVCISLRSGNEALRVRVAELEAEKAALSKKIDLTLGRLQALVTRLPEE